MVTITILRPAIFCFFFFSFVIKVSSLNCHVCVFPFESFCSCFQLAAMKANTVASRSIEKWNLHFCLSYLLKAYQNWQDNQTLKWNFPWKSPATQTLPVAVYSKSDEIKITINNFLWKWEISSHLDQVTFFHYSFFWMNSKFSVIYWVWSCIRLEKCGNWMGNTV